MSLSNSSSGSDDEEYDDSTGQTLDNSKDCDGKLKERNHDRRHDYAIYTEEQKIVSAVWMHERSFNYQTIEEIRNNFRIRFKTDPPRHNTLVKWEKRLFSSGALGRARNRKPLERLIHVPYVKASLKEKPGLTLTERARQLGISKKALNEILKYDIKDCDSHSHKDKNEDETVVNEINIKDDLDSKTK